MELRAALDGWIHDTKDRSLVPETEYLEKVGNYWDQPQTATPHFIKKGNLFQLKPSTPGAAIGYQWLSSNEEPKDSWHVYTSPLESEDNKILVARAHRIGYKPNDLVKFENN